MSRCPQLCVARGCTQGLGGGKPTIREVRWVGSRITCWRGGTQSLALNSTVAHAGWTRSPGALASWPQGHPASQPPLTSRSPCTPPRPLSWGTGSPGPFCSPCPTPWAPQMAPPVGSWVVSPRGAETRIAGTEQQQTSPEHREGPRCALGHPAVLGPKGWKAARLGLQAVGPRRGRAGSGRASPPPASLLRRLQCGRCQWGWASAHVHGASTCGGTRPAGLGWSRACLGPAKAKQPARGGLSAVVSLLNVWLFLDKLGAVHRAQVLR